GPGGGRGAVPPRALQRAGPAAVRGGADPSRPPPGGGGADRTAPADLAEPLLAAVPRLAPTGGADRRRRDRGAAVARPAGAGGPVDPAAHRRVRQLRADGGRDPAPAVPAAGAGGRGGGGAPRRRGLPRQPARPRL